jgi:bacterioferritin-associated ferredoxin
VYLCLCKGVTERDVERCAGEGYCSEEALIAALGLDDAGTCGRCRREIRRGSLAEWLRGAAEAIGTIGAVSPIGRTAESNAFLGAAGPSTSPRAPRRPLGCGRAACGASLCPACAAGQLAASRPLVETSRP